jgi:hypothetical protein
MIMAATKLGVFNAALDELGDHAIADTGEGVERARVLNRRWDRAVEDCMNEASWNFLTESARIYADTGFTAEFGYAKKFDKPADWVRTLGVSEDEHFSFPHLAYEDKSGHWRAENEPIYVCYVSSDTGLAQLSNWPSAFTRYVEVELAARAAIKLAQGEGQKERIEKDRDAAKKKAKNIDAMDEVQPKFPPPSNWTLARAGRSGGRERGRRGSLIG